MTNTAWGAVPASVRGLVDVLEEQIAEHSQRLSAIEWPTSPGDISPALLDTLREVEAVFSAAKDLRSVLTAYAHQVHQPRPVMADVARAQGASPQAVATRYTTKTVEAVEALIAAEDAASVAKPDPNQVRAAVEHAKSELERALQSQISDEVGEIVRAGKPGAGHDFVQDSSIAVDGSEL